MMRHLPRRLRAALRTALVIATIVSSYRALGWSYYALCPAGRREADLARTEVLFQEGLEALHVRGDPHATIVAWSQAIRLLRRYPDTEAEQAGCSAHIADVLLELGRGAEALALYERALELYRRTRYTEIDQGRCRKVIAALRAGVPDETSPTACDAPG